MTNSNLRKDMPLQARTRFVHWIFCTVLIWSSIPSDYNVLQSVESFLSTFSGRQPTYSNRHPIRNIYKSLTALLSGDLENSAYTDGVTIIAGPWNSTKFGTTGCWGRRPILIRNAFNDTTMLPTWEDILNLASEAFAQENDDGIVTSRLIEHIPGTLNTYRAEFGPFHSSEILRSFDSNGNKVDEADDAEEYVPTLVVNDVDRWIPEVSHWMDETFGRVLPRWRRDDAQISIAPRGGGIGPHVDNYDVFLIQIEGSRCWRVGPMDVSHCDEEDLLVPSSEVSILDLTKRSSMTHNQSALLHLEKGDCLYLPPRAVHCGESTSDDCVTLSVGCRSPSASELLARVTEYVATSTKASANERYKDLNRWSISSSTTKGIDDEKIAMKILLLQAVKDVVENDSLWDSIVGQTITESKRPVGEYPVSVNDMSDEWKSELGIWADPIETMNALLSGHGSLYRSEGLSFATSTVGDTHRMFVQGRSFEVSSLDEGDSPAFATMLSRIANGPPLNLEALEKMNMIPLPVVLMEFLQTLLSEGIIYGWSDEP